jgi:hypothetical protein
LEQLASAALRVFLEIASILEGSGFQQGKYADQLRSQLTTKDMSNLASKLLDIFDFLFIFVMFFIFSFMMKSDFFFMQGASSIMETIYSK